MVKVFLLLFLSGVTGCNKPASTANPASTASPTVPSSPPMASASDGAVQKKLGEYSGSGATNCGTFGVQATPDQLKTASECATKASQAKKPFTVAYDMPGMSVGVAGDGQGKLFTVQSQGGGLSSGACPSQLRVASSGRVTCFAPGDMGSMSGSHTAGSMPAGMPNPHASDTANPHAAPK